MSIICIQKQKQSKELDLQVTLDRSLQRNQLEKLLRLHMVEASTREEGVIQVARNS